MSKLSKVWYQKNSPCCSVLLWTSFCFLQVSQQKLVGMVSTSNIAYSEQIYTNLFSGNHPILCFWLRREGRQMPNTEQLLYQTEKSSHQRFFIKTLFLKILQYSWENTCVKCSRTPVLKNICAQLFLNWLFEVIVWNFVSGLHTRSFQTRALNKIWHICPLYV